MGRKIVLVLVSAMVTVVVAEGSLGFIFRETLVSAIDAKTKKIFSCYQPDAETVYLTIPENKICERTDKSGYRLHEGASSAASAVVFLGDSYVYGNYVDEGHTVPALVQQSLNQKMIGLSVINAGIPGFGIDQEYVHLVRHVLPKVKPKVVFWVVHENDWDEYEYGCLIGHNSDPTILSARRNTLYWYAVIAPHLPGWAMSSNIYALIHKAIPENLTYGCSARLPLSIEQQNNKIKKVLQMAIDLGAREGFALRFIYAQGQFAYENVPSENYRYDTEQKLALFRSMNIDPLIVSEAIRQKAQTSADAGNVTGAKELSQELFVLDDPSGYGGQHMNETGNRLFAEAVYDAYFQ